MLIGISLYAKSGSPMISDLKYAAADAQSIYDFLRSRQGGSFPEKNITLLLDEEATKKNVEKALADLKQAQPQDYYVIFIAGHGAIGPSRSKPGAQVPYFALHDTNPNDLPGTAIDMRVLREMAEKDFPNKGLVICDTCHSGGVLDQSQRDPLPLPFIPANPLFIQEVNNLNKGVGFLLAAGELESSKEFATYGNGVFTHCLLNALRGEADFNDDKIDFCEVGTYMREEIPKLVSGRNMLALPNTIDANYLPLSLVSYTEAGDNHSILLIRSPDVDGVEVAIDGKHIEKLRIGGETSLMVTPAEHKVEFTKEGKVLGSLIVKPDSGRFKNVSIEYRFGGNEGQVGPSASFNLPEKGLSGKADSIFKKGIESFNKQRFQEAIKEFDAVINMNKGVYCDALVYRGRALQSLRRHKEAIAAYTEAFRLKKSDCKNRDLAAGSNVRFQR